MISLIAEIFIDQPFRLIQVNADYFFQLQCIKSNINYCLYPQEMPILLKNLKIKLKFCNSGSTIQWFRIIFIKFLLCNRISILMVGLIKVIRIM